MTKTKTMLYVASAAAALLTAGNVSASDLVGRSGGGLVDLSGVTSVGTASTPVLLASELSFTASASTGTAFTRSTGTVSFRLTPSAGNNLPTTTELVLTLELGNAIFNEGSPAGTVVTVSDNTAGATPTVAVSPLSGVSAGGRTATYTLNLSGFEARTTTGSGTVATDFGDGLIITLPIRATGGGDATFSANLTTQSGNLEVDGGKKTVTFLRPTPAFTVAFATGTSAVANVTDNFEKLVTDGVTAGTITVATATGSVVSNLATGVAASAADVAALRVSVLAANGVSGFNLTSGLSTFTASTATISDTRTLAITSGILAAHPIVVNDSTGTSTGTATADIIARNGVINATPLAVTAVLDLIDASTATTPVAYFRDQTFTGSLAPVTRNGTTFIAPWVALGSATTASNIRLANNGTRATGPIRVVLKSDNGTAAPTTTAVTITQADLSAGTLNSAGGLDVGDAATFTGATLARLFGATAANGDVEISIEAPTGTISGKVRNTQSGGNIHEISLGNL